MTPGKLFIHHQTARTAVMLSVAATESAMHWLHRECTFGPQRL